MRYCPKCFKNLDKDYDSCPICGYKDENSASSISTNDSFQENDDEIFSGSVFQILDDMDSPYSYDYDADYDEDVYNNSSDIYANPYETEDIKKEHICQNERLENNESVLDKNAHICQNERLENNESVLDSNKHICQNEILERINTINPQKPDTRLIQQRLQENKKLAMQRSVRPSASFGNSSDAMAEKLMAKNNKININELKLKNNQANMQNNRENVRKEFYKYSNGKNATVYTKTIVGKNLNDALANPEKAVEELKNVGTNSPLFLASIILSFINPIIGIILATIFYKKTKNKFMYIILLFICSFSFIPFIFSFIFSLL